ncbi:glycosyltransferase family 39 protein [Candidatus Roizmanbacteria bacterium]|nr:MAG: glycosyltransferase family 39 protein [Candidatus Roizmanbacteria bacterium]
MKSKYLPYLMLTGIIVLGFLFRLRGISADHSFWADESYIASISRDIAQGKTAITDLFSIVGASYQPLQVIVMSVSFFIFGVSEWAARIPSVIFGTVGIFLAYLVGKNFSNKAGGLLSAFLYSFAELNLAYATQARSYAALTAIILAIVYCLQLLSQKNLQRKKQILLHVGVVVLSFVAWLFHIVASLFFVIYGGFIIIHYRKSLFSFAKKHLIWTALGILGILLFVYVSQAYQHLLNLNSSKVNNVTYLRELFARQYLFLVLPALFGLLLSYKKYIGAVFGIGLWGMALLFLWTFFKPSHNIRYILPLFPVLYVFFGVFWARAGEKMFNKQSGLICGIIALILLTGGYKISRKPAVYYSPNADLYADVQNANYKDAFAFIEKKYPNYQDMIIFNDIIDAQRWYLTEKPNADAYFAKHANPPRPHVVNNVMEYGTLKDFLKEQSKHEKGLLIVEDWESILPEDIKQYAKKNMKLEYRVESLEVSPTDKWPIEIYSWGMEE